MQAVAGSRIFCFYSALVISLFHPCWPISIPKFHGIVWRKIQNDRYVPQLTVSREHRGVVSQERFFSFFFFAKFPIRRLGTDFHKQDGLRKISKDGSTQDRTGAESRISGSDLAGASLRARRLG